MHRIRGFTPLAFSLWDSLPTLQWWLLSRLFPWFFRQERWWGFSYSFSFLICNKLYYCSPTLGQSHRKTQNSPPCLLLLQISGSLHNLTAFVYSSKSLSVFSRVCNCYKWEDWSVRELHHHTGRGTPPYILLSLLFLAVISLEPEQELRDQVTIFLSAST